MHGIIRLLLGGLLMARLAAALPVFEPFNHAAGAPLNGLATPEGLVWGRIGAGGAPQINVAFVRPTVRLNPATDAAINPGSARRR